MPRNSHVMINTKKSLISTHKISLYSNGSLLRRRSLGLSRGGGICDKPKERLRRRLLKRRILLILNGRLISGLEPKNLRKRFGNSREIIFTEFFWTPKISEIVSNDQVSQSSQSRSFLGPRPLRGDWYK